MGKGREYHMITFSSQKWLPGEVVKVGFLMLRVVSCRAVKDGQPDIYSMESIDGLRRYEFIPHRGLYRLTDPLP